MSETKDYVRVLQRAKRLIERRGWCQKNYVNAGAHCTLGAIREFDPSMETALVMEKALKLRNDYLWQWNDKPRRTEEQVLKAFDKAIAYAKAHKSDSAQEES